MEPSVRQQLELLKKVSPAERLEIADALAAQTPAAAGTLISGLRDGDWHIRWGAAHALGKGLTAGAAPGLRSLLEDPQPRVARTAAWALGRLRDRDSVGHLARALHSPSVHLSASAAWALGHIGSAEALEALAGALESASPKTLRSISLAFAEIGPEASENLVTILQEGSATQRTRAAQILSRFGTHAARLLLPLLSSAEVKQRRAGAHILGTLRLKEGEQPGKKESTLRSESTDLIAVTGNPEEQSSNEENETGLLCQMETVLTAALEDEDLRVRCSAARSLGALGLITAGPAIERLLSGNSEDIRAAANALGALGDPAAGPALLGVLERGSAAAGDNSPAANSAAALPANVEAALHRALQKLGLEASRPRRAAPPQVNLPTHSDYMAATTPGLEAVAWEEIAVQLPGASLRSFGNGAVIFHWTGSPQAGAVLRSIRSLVQGGSVPKEIPLAKRLRRYRVKTLPASLDPTTAYCLSRLANLGERDVFVDLMCGSGTIALERALLGPASRILAGDVDQEALRCARENITAGAQPVVLVRWDAQNLPLPDHSVNSIAANLPYGRRSGLHRDNLILYPAVLKEVERVLKKPGIAVLLTLEKRLLRHCLESHPSLQLVSEREIETGGLRPAVFILQK